MSELHEFLEEHLNAVYKAEFPIHPRLMAALLETVEENKNKGE